MICSNHTEILSANKHTPCPVCIAEARIRDLESALRSIRDELWGQTTNYAKDADEIARAALREKVR